MPASGQASAAAYSKKRSRRGRSLQRYGGTSRERFLTPEHMDIAVGPGVDHTQRGVIGDELFG